MTVVTHMASPRGSNGRLPIRRFASHGLAYPARGIPLTPDKLVRRRYFGRPIIANADAVMLKELRRIGGLLKHIHNESGGIYNKDTAGALVALKAYIGKLSRDRQEG